jgi:hypothetical protein
MIKHLITKLFFKYCYQESEMASYVVCYWVPNVIKKMDGSKMDGQFLFAQLNKKSYELESWMDVNVEKGEII